MENLVKFFLLLCLVSCSGLKRHSDQNPSAAESSGGSSELSEDSTKLAEEGPKDSVGVILGPGYLASFAHLGVLKEFEAKDIKIDAIAGMGWGALFAAGFAVEGRTSNLEWQMFKLGEDSLPEKTLFGNKLKPAKAEKLDPLLDKLFGRKQIQSGSVSFVCSSTNLQSFRNRLIDQGSYSAAVKSCGSGNSFYQPSRNWVWAPFSVNQIAKEMRSRNITKLVYVDILSKASINESFSGDSTFMDKQIWIKSSEIAKSSRELFDYYIQINLGKTDIKDPSKVRDLVRLGRDRSRAEVNKISEQVLGR